MCLSTSSQAAVLVAEDTFTYSDGSIVGQGTAGSGWAGAWANGFGADFVVTGGTLNDAGNGRVTRELATSIGGVVDSAMIYTIAFNAGFAQTSFSAFEAHNGSASDSNRVIQINHQTLTIGSGNIDFTDVTGINDYTIKLIFGATNTDQDTAELFLNDISQGSAVNIGTSFEITRVGFGVFNGSVTAADNLAINLVPEPTSFGLIALGGLVFAIRRKR